MEGFPPVPLLSRCRWSVSYTHLDVYTRQNLHIAHAARRELFIQDIGTVSCAVHPAFHNLFRGFLSPGNIFAGASVADALLLQRRTEISSVRSGMGKGRLDFNRPYLCGRLYVLINLQRGQACFCTFLIYQPCHLGSKGKLVFIILRSIISRISARFFLVGIVLARFVLIRLLIRFVLVRLIGSRLILIRRAVDVYKRQVLRSTGTHRRLPQPPSRYPG